MWNKLHRIFYATTLYKWVRPALSHRSNIFYINFYQTSIDLKLLNESYSCNWYRRNVTSDQRETAIHRQILSFERDRIVYCQKCSISKQIFWKVKILSRSNIWIVFSTRIQKDGSRFEIVVSFVRVLSWANVAHLPVIGLFKDAKKKIFVERDDT